MAEHTILVERPETDEDMPDKCLYIRRKPLERMLWQRFLQLTEYEFYDPDEEIKRLRRRVSRLESKLIARPVTTRGDKVYETLRSTLERKYPDKIVAIDTEQGEIAGAGDTIEEAYRQARAKRPDKKQFYFRRVGKSYLLRAR